MKQFRFILLCATIAVISSSLTGCKKGVYDEKAALAAQKDLLQFKYDQEIKLENLRAANNLTFYNSYFALQYNFSERSYKFSDSLSRSTTAYNNDQYRRRDIAVKVIDLVTDAPVVGAEVTIPTLVGTVIKVKTDSTGVARFTPNINIPNPASAIATMDGYASGSVFATIAGSTSAGASATISIWNLKNAPNTVKGRIYIENDLTNDAAEVAKKAFVNAFTLVTVNGYEQRFDFIATTDDNGDYSMKIPNLTNPLQFAHAALEGTSKMYVQGYVPGSDTVPSVKSIAATYFLGTGAVISNQKNVGYTISSNMEQPDNTLFSIPSSVSRYHVSSAVLDSNGRGHYVKGITFSASTLSSATADTAILNGSTIYTNSSLLSASNYSSNTTTPTTQYPSRYLAGTTVRDTVNATLYDLAANADGYWTAAPTLKFVLVTDSTTTVNKKFKYIEKLIQVKGGGTTRKADVNFTHNQTLLNLIKTNSGVTSSSYNSRTINSGFTSISTTNINNGKTIVRDLSFGAGKLSTAVR
jgi:hypothetical protein